MIKILLFDIETAPSRGYYFDPYKEGNILWTDQDWFILSFAYKWFDKKATHVKALPDYKRYNKDKNEDYNLVLDLWNLFNDADIIIGHNGDRFDIRKANARFIKHGLPPTPPYKTIDTLKVARKYFKFDSNRLDALGEYLGLGRKEKTGGIGLWADCMQGDARAWNQMKKYNKQDVILLEKVYEKLRPWMTNHPNINIVDETLNACPVCGGLDLEKRGYYYTQVSKTQRFHCLNLQCGKWSRGKSIRTALEIR